MRTGRLGRTDLVVSQMGLGLAALGRPGYINLGHREDLGEGTDPEAMRQRTHSLLDAAWAAGVRYFDAARSYGLAEDFLREWLAARRIAPGEAAVGSKWGYTYVAGWQVDVPQHEVKDHSLSAFRRQVAETHALLGAHLGLYQIHSVTPESGVLGDAAVLEELLRRRAAGLRLGLSASGPRQAEVLRRALDVAPGGTPLFDCVQATWNVLEPSAGAVLREAHARGVGVIVKEPLANGRLTARNRDPDFTAQRAVLERIASQHATSLDAVGLAAVLRQPWAEVVLSGAVRQEHLMSNLGAFDVRLAARDVAELDTLAEAPEAYWATRARLPWN